MLLALRGKDNTMWNLSLVVWIFLWLPARDRGLTLNKCCPTSNQVLDAEGHCVPRHGKGVHSASLWEKFPFIQYNNLSDTLCVHNTDAYVVSRFNFTNSNNEYFHLNETDSLVHHRELCFDQTGQESSSVVARYCPKKCQTQKCVRKCCLPGFAMNEEDYQCVPSNDSLTEADLELFELHSENETIYKLAAADLGISFVGFNRMPRSLCPDGAYMIGPEVEPDYQTFHLLANGQLYVPGNVEAEKVLENFCLDQMYVNGSLQLIAVVCFPPQYEETQDIWVARNVFVPLEFVSATFLLLTFLVYALLPELRNLHGLTIMCHVLALFMTYVGLGIVQIATLPPSVCLFLALMTHFFFLSAFAWMNTMSFDIWWAITQMRTTRKRSRRERPCRKFFRYSLYAWGAPGVIVLTGFILDTISPVPDWVIRPRFGVTSCWFRYLPGEPISRRPELYYLYGPIAVTVLGNIVLFSLTASFLCQARGSVASSITKQRNKQRLRVVFNVFILMGVTWIMEIVSWAVGGSAYYWMPSDIFNILQGVLVFVIFVCKRNVLTLLYQRGEPLWNCWRATCPSWCGCHWLNKYYVSPEASSSSNPTVSSSVSQARKSSCALLHSSVQP